MEEAMTESERQDLRDFIARECMGWWEDGNGVYWRKDKIFSLPVFDYRPDSPDAPANQLLIHYAPGEFNGVKKACMKKRGKYEGNPCPWKGLGGVAINSPNSRPGSGRATWPPPRPGKR